MAGSGELKEELHKLKEKIKETKKRIPAHSVKPPVMMELLELEDRYDVVLSRIREINAD